jgi:hypothetical protein
MFVGGAVMRWHNWTPLDSIPSILANSDPSQFLGLSMARLNAFSFAPCGVGLVELSADQIETWPAHAPILDASSGTIDYISGRRGTVLKHAKEGQVHGVVIECLQCGAFNATDMLGTVPDTTNSM